MLKNARASTASTVGTMSMSSRRMAASLPPSSRVTRLRSLPAATATRFPLAIEPVKLTLRGVGCAVMRAPSSSPPLTTLTTPGGSTSLMTSPRRRAAKGVNGDGFTTTVLPTRSAGASFVIVITTGKFHGRIAATTPRGRWRISMWAWASSAKSVRGTSTDAA